MTSRVVKSTAGESIEIVPDAEWAELTGVSERGMKLWQTGTKPLVFRALWEHGKFTHKSGQAGSKLIAYINTHYSPESPAKITSYSGLMREGMNAPCFERKLNGKRTYLIKLIAMPESWHGKLLADIEANQPPAPEEPPAAPETAPEEHPPPEVVTAAPVIPELDTGVAFTEADWAAIRLDAPTVYEEPPPLELHIANQVAMSLLTTVVEIISAGGDPGDLPKMHQLQSELQHSQELLSARLSENQKLRRQIGEIADMNVALKGERDGLRTRLRQTEHNLQQALKGEAAQAVNHEIQKRLDQVMRTTPTPKGE